MNQQITISQNLINYFAENLPAIKINNAQRIIKLLEENKLVDNPNRDYFRKIYLQLREIENESLKNELAVLIEKWYQDNRYEISNDYTKEEIFASHSSDKIFLNPKLNDKGKKVISDKFGIEAHNVETFIAPRVTEKLKHSNMVIRLLKDTSYDLAEILKPFIRDTSLIRIEDPYLPNRNGLKNLKKIIQKSACKKLQVKYLPEQFYNKNNTTLKNKLFGVFISYLDGLESKECYSIKKILYQDHTHHERYIITDGARIHLPGGLDFLNSHGKINTSEEFVELTITTK